jgi:hypothetical protein
MKAPIEIRHLKDEAGYDEPKEAKGAGAQCNVL